LPSLQIQPLQFSSPGPRRLFPACQQGYGRISIIISSTVSKEEQAAQVLLCDSLNTAFLYDKSLHESSFRKGCAAVGWARGLQNTMLRTELACCI